MISRIVHRCPSWLHVSASPQLIILFLSIFNVPYKKKFVHMHILSLSLSVEPADRSPRAADGATSHVWWWINTEFDFPLVQDVNSTEVEAGLELTR